jgi:hypothetical protein
MGNHKLEPFYRVKRRENGLFVIDRNGQLAGDYIGDAPRIMELTKGGQVGRTVILCAAE